MKKEVREGYKMTELGEIPKEWIVAKISDCTNDIFLGLTSKVDYVENNGIPLIRTTDISDGKLNFQNVKYISLEQHKKLTKYRKVSKGDILVSKSGTLGSCCIVDTDREFSIYESIIAIKTNKNELKSDYLFQLLKDKKSLKRMLNNRVGGVVGHLNIKSFREILITVPTLREQEKISEILSTVDEQIDNTEKLIRKNKELKKGLMQQLLTKGIGHTQFKKTEIGDIPKEWEVKKLGEVCNLQGGYAFKSKDYLDEGIKLVKITNVQQKNIIWDEVSYLPKNYLDKYNEYSLVEGDLVIAMTRPVISTGIKICEVNVNDLPSLLNQRVGRFKCKKEINNKFLYQYMFTDYFLNKVKLLSSMTGQPNISSSQIEFIDIVIPSLIEQEKIALILSSIDKKIEQYKYKKEKLEELKKGLMKQLLNGNIRVI
ncbi:TPA: restriction endonuclease subunit S [Clostridium perfringens]